MQYVLAASPLAALLKASMDRLAYCKLYIAVAALTLRVMDHMRLYCTTDTDVVHDFDLALAMPKRGGKGIRVDMF
ncbi:cytochrome p450 oxidoreductase [Colletotrichum incanum]|uniref:Cytochrome p450 oxidoreductase n=1 Tax=Colletotrichum incanum TaxID=1573173 RepID=A0A167B0F6_COLIC|nr:cytochrome p450 oxidoreductase [Colletotrichum incanum]